MMWLISVGLKVDQIYSGIEEIDTSNHFVIENLH